MVTRRAHSIALENIGGSSDPKATVETHTVMDELHIQSQTLEDNVLNIAHRQQEVTPTEETEVLDP